MEKKQENEPAGRGVAMKFTKMQGCGNDYIYINGFAEKIPREEKPQLVQRLSDRHFGIGGDGVIFINPSEEADFEMEMYNADGTRAQMCGNGMRCVGKYVYEKRLTDKTSFRVISGGQIKYLELFLKQEEKAAALQEGMPVSKEAQQAASEEENVSFLQKKKEAGSRRGIVEKVRVNMGKPQLVPEKIPVLAKGGSVVKMPVLIGGKGYEMTCVSMGNPHAVVFTGQVRELDLEKIGPLWEHSELFPERVNTEFAEVISPEKLFMRVWERGTGETLACGTGCCAVAVAGVLCGLTKRKVTIQVLGGELEIEWDEQTDEVFMTGPAETVFEGEIPYPFMIF